MHDTHRNTMILAYAEIVAGTSYTDSIMVATTDGMITVVTVTINSLNDAAAITGIDTGTLAETNVTRTTTGTPRLVLAHKPGYKWGEIEPILITQLTMSFVLVWNVG